MEYCQIIIPKNSAYLMTKSIGEENICQFMDLNHQEPSYKRLYSVESRTCNDVLDMIEKILKIHDKYLNLVGPSIAKMNLQGMQNLRDIDRVFDPFFAETRPVELRKYQDTKLTSLNEFDNAFQLTRTELDTLELYMKAFDVLKGLTTRKRENYDGSSALSLVTGCVLRKDQTRFQRTMMRISRGNAAVYFKELNYDKQKDYVVFVVLIVGQQGGILNQRCVKAAGSFEKAKIFVIPEQEEEQMSVQHEKKKELEYKNMLYNKSINLILMELRDCAKCVSHCETSNIIMDQAFLKKQKGIYESMNKFHNQGGHLIAECWVPQIQVKNLYEIVELKNQGNVQIVHKMIQGEMKVLTQNITEIEKCELTPPTFFRQNPLTEVFQLVTDTYGIPRQKEINPTIFNIISFPFQFGVMFGDIFHGTLFFLVGLVLVLLDSKINLGPVKQVILQMGFWAMFMGYIYNDFTGLSLNLFGGCYTLNEKTNVYTQKPNCLQPFGTDPVWGHSGEEITFSNSFKMKLAIIIGVTQMTFGVILKGLNNIYQRNMIDFFFEFVPQILFITLMFGWMSALIIIKWTVQSIDGNHANLITTMINMVMRLGGADSSTNVMNIDTQTTIQRTFIIIALLCIPTMLLMKPILLSRHHDSKAVHIPSIQPLVKEHAPHAFSELFVHQMIETIEQVLGCVSNTASQLRLWALSLAHSQLSQVFFNQLFKSTLGMNFIFISLGFIVFMSVTIGVLMCMDSMECFLHALRLHWVEFQNKFYKADGKKFRPFRHADSVGIE